MTYVLLWLACQVSTTLQQYMSPVSTSPVQYVLPVSMLQCSIGTVLHWCQQHFHVDTTTVSLTPVKHTTQVLMTRVKCYYTAVVDTSEVLIHQCPWYQWSMLSMLHVDTGEVLLHRCCRHLWRTEIRKYLGQFSKKSKLAKCQSQEQGWRCLM